MATITKSIGATARDYSTITLWEAALGGAAGGGGNDAIGECYDDAVFDEAITIDDGTPDTITLAAASGEEHDGTAGIGARVVRSASGAVLIVSSAKPVRVEILEFDGNKQSNSANTNLLWAGGGAPVIVFHRLIVHGALLTSGTLQGVLLYQNDVLQNSFVYNIDSQAGGSAVVVGVNVSAGAAFPTTLLNTTVHNIVKNGTGACSGVLVDDSANNTVQNVISTDAVNDGAGSAVCFSPASFSNATVDHNLASDTTASGTGSLDSKTSANQFVSNVEDSEDLKLKTGADAIDAGTDLGTTPDDIEFDIIGFDRDTAAVTWDMGGHEFVAVAGAIMNQLQAANVGADLYNGALLV